MSVYDHQKTHSGMLTVAEFIVAQIKKDCMSALVPYIRIPYNTRNEQNVKTHNSISKTNEAA